MNRPQETATLANGLDALHYLLFANANALPNAYA